MLVVNFFGGPGSGKTTSALKLASDLKQNTALNIQYITEFATDLILSGQKHCLEDDRYQLWVTTSQMKKHLDAEHCGTKILVTDAPLLMGYVYHKDPDVQKCILKLTKHWRQYNVFVDRADTPYIQYGRVHTYEQSREIDAVVKGMVHFEEFVTKQKPLDWKDVVDYLHV